MTDEASAEPPAVEASPSTAPATELSRRGLLGLALGAGAFVGAGVGASTALRVTREGQGVVSQTQPFFGEHQSGITTEMQDHLHFAAFDVMETSSREDLIELLQDWSYAAARMMLGLEVSATGAVGGSPEAPPDDTGEALGLPASNLTITFGFGPSLFRGPDGSDRFGIASQAPASLVPLPAFLGDDLDPGHTGGDLCVQACADDPQVAVHAVRNLSRIAFGRARLRWSQLGFGRTSRTSAQHQTPRNLFGFKDGTANILGTDAEALTEHVWVSPQEGPAWLAGGSYLIARKIAMKIETWDRVRLAEQERITGRAKGSGAPLSGGNEFAAPNFATSGPAGGPAIDPRSHVARAHPDLNGGIRMLRRGYNYVDGNNALGRLDAGLFFLGYVRAPERFITVQRSVASDLMMEYLLTIGSGLWAVPPAPREGSFVGAALFS